MTPFQWIAVPIFVGLLVLELVWLARGPSRSRLAALRCVVWLGAALAIAQQQWVQRLADSLGIGRGADLVTYVLAIAFVAITFFLYSRHMRTQVQLTEIVRHLAIVEARRGRDARPAALRD